jgi:CHAT domain-containing protein/Flp pilus assembly protein TadD
VRKAFLLLIGVLSTIVLAVCLAPQWKPLLFPTLEESLRVTLEKKPDDTAARIQLAQIFLGKNNLLNAVFTLQEGLKYDPDNPELLRLTGLSQATLGNATQNKKQMASSVRYLERALAGKPNDATTTRNLAWACMLAERNRKVVALCGKILEITPDDPWALSLLGYASIKYGKYEDALASLEKAATSPLADHLTFWRLADAQRLLGDYQTAYLNAQKALEKASAQDKPEIRSLIEYTARLKQKDRRYENYYAHATLAERHTAQKRSDRAAAEYQAAITFSPEDAFPEMGYCELQVGKFYSYLGQYEKSIEYFQKAEEHCLKGRSQNDLPFVYQSMSKSYALLEKVKPERKSECDEKCLRASEQELEWARKVNNQHMVEHALSDNAVDRYNLYGAADTKVIELRREMAKYISLDTPLTNCAYESIVGGEAYMRFKEKDYEGARPLYELVAQYYDGQPARIEDIKAAVYCNGALSFIAREQQRYGDAIALGKKTMTQLARVRDLVGIDEYRRQAGGLTLRDQCEQFLYTTYVAKDSSAAFIAAEEYKARALLDLLGAKDKPATLSHSEVLAKTEASFAERRNKSLSVETPDTPVNDVSSQRDLAIEETVYGRLPEDTASAQRAVKSTAEVAALDFEQFKPVVNDLCFVSYFAGQEHSMAVVVSSDGITPVLLDGVTEESLRKELEDFRRALRTSAAPQRDLALEIEGSAKLAPKDAEKTYTDISAKLWEQLIAPVIPFINKKLVCICPDTVLNYLPFEALVKDGRCLLDDYTIVYAPSASVLKLCMDKNRNRHDSILALGNPNLKNPAFRLANAENEVTALTGLFPESDIKYGDAATETYAKEQAPSFDILHFACHGELNMDDPMLTSLRLAPDDKNDGYLHASEVFDLNLNASLVILSACNTALGELSSGNELMGLTRSFLYAGTPALIASLWTVDDKSTSQLMQLFYKNLSSMNKAEALRQAKLALKKDYPNPFHWAAFSLQGDYR